MQLDYIVWFTNWCGELQEWPASCPCHQERFERGQPNDCVFKGKLMVIAHVHITKKLNGALETSESWTEHDWSDSFTFLTEVQGSMRAAHSFATEMLGFLDRVPYLTARLSIPGEARRAIAQFDSVPKEHHNRNSIAVYSASQPSLRAQVLAITADAKNISPALQFEIDSMQEINCDDTIDEEPHAAMKRIIAASRRGNFPWQSASVSLNQTLQDARDLPSALDVDSQDLWNRYTSLLQVKQKLLE